MITHASLFTGIGGFDLAAQWMNWENIFQCENNEWCSKLLKQNFPKTEKHGDITKTDFTVYRGKIDVLTGGFPCQPFSVAGKRKGKEDDRFLWHEMLRAIKEIQPIWVVAENVYGIINQGGGLVFEQVCIEMENEGYEVQPYLLPACGVGAIHKRERFWFVAYSKSNENKRRGQGGFHTQFAGTDVKEFTSDSNSERLQLRNCSYKWEVSSISERIQNNRETNRLERNGIVTNTNINIRCEGGLYSIKREKAERYVSTCSSRESRGNWENFPTQSPLCRRNDGVSNRVDRIKGLGNAIVPQVAYELFKVIDSMCIIT